MLRMSVKLTRVTRVVLPNTLMEAASQEATKFPKLLTENITRAVGSVQPPEELPSVKMDTEIIHNIPLSITYTDPNDNRNDPLIRTVLIGTLIVESSH